MGYRNREKEIKLEVVGSIDMDKIDRLCRKLYKPVNIIVGNRTDFYWPAKAADFVRVRQMTDDFNGPGQETVKKSDKGNNFNRIEIDANVENVNQTVKMKTVEYGQHPKPIKKRYSVLFLQRHDETNISVYQVKGDPKKRVFVEVESRTCKRVEDIVKNLRNLMPYKLKRVPYSLYDIFVLGRGEGRKR